MKLLVCGGRTYDDIDAVRTQISALLPVSEIIHGAARGADSLAAQVGSELGIKCTACPADWAQYGRAAGHIRNAVMCKMLSEGDIVLAFPGGAGTANMVKLALAKGIRVIQYAAPSTSKPDPHTST